MSACWKQMICGSLVLGFAAFWDVRAANGEKDAEDRSFLLTASDVKDFRALIIKLRNGREPASAFIRDHCLPPTRELIYSYHAGTPPSDELCNRLIGDLNSLMRSGSIYEKDRFADVSLSSETRSLIQQSPKGKELVRLNRMLLDQLYAAELVKAMVEPLDVRADTLEYDSERNMFIGSGHVTVRQGDEMLRSDHAIVNLETYDVFAEGHVFFEQGSDAWSGEKLRYNFRTKRGNFGKFVSFLDPFYVRAEESYRVSENEYRFKKAIVTTCEGEAPLAYLKANTLTMVPGRHVRGRHVLLHIRRFPIMYSPYWNQNIGDPNFISMVPGYNSRMSAFLLTAFNYRLTRHLEAATHVDYRVKRGPGVGQDLLWSSSGNAKGLSTERYMEEEDDSWYFGRKTKAPDIEEEEEDTWFGDLITYYTYDSWPDEGEEQVYPIDSDRYRMRLYHSHSIDERNYFVSQFGYLSDPKIIEQFFRDEYKHAPEPENYLVLGHRGDKYNASFQVEKRLNDFYTLVDRFPEAKVDFTRQEIGRSSLYYEGETAGGYLQKQWESIVTNESDYSAFRFDTDNKVYYSMKWFEFLNVMPRGGYRATFYSKTKEDYQEISETTSVDSNGAAVVTSVTNDLTRETGSELRSVYEMGVESSFKAFKVWEAYPGGIIHNLRHIAEPYVNYTYVPEPNVAPTNLYQFDEVDAIDRANNIRIGMINKLQTKRDETVYDFINADVWTFWKFGIEDDENTFSNIFFDVQSTLYEEWMYLRIDGGFDQYDSAVETFNTRLTIEDKTLWKNELEHRYSDASSSLLYDQLTISPFVNWKYCMYGRYEFETQDLQAWGVSIQRTLECITVRLGAEEQDDDFQIWLQFWFTEFPKARVDMGV